MENVTIVSHLTPQEWKKSWEDKVVEDTKQNMRAYQQQNCYWGHFKNDRDFTICHHKEFEIKGMSLGLYFNGRIEDDERGCKIVGKFGKKHSANLFLGMGAALCIAAIIGAVVIVRMVFATFIKHLQYIAVLSIDKMTEYVTLPLIKPSLR